MQQSANNAGCSRAALQGAKASPPSSQLLQWTLDCSADALAVVDADLRVLAVNEAWRSAFGAEDAGPMLDALGGAALAEACLGGDQRALDIVDQKGLAGRLSISCWRTDAGEIGGLTLRHAPVRGDAQYKPIERSSRRLRLAMEKAKVIAFEFDFRTGACIFDPPSAAPGKPIRGFEDIIAVLPDHEREAARQAWRSHMQTGEVLMLEYQWPTATGEMGWHMNACEAMRDKHGEVVGMIGMRQDITDRKHAELAIVAEREAAKEADKAKSNFLANMSHEIRTPLNGVLAMSQVMARGALNGGQRERLGVIRQSGEDLLHVINDILDFSKIEAGKLTLESVVFDPIRELDNTLAGFATEAERKGLQLRVEVAEDARGERRGDSARLRQIVNNYLSNAMKFTAEGEICVSVAGVGDLGRDGLTISVRDCGIGIAAHKMPLLFQKFSQLDASTTRQFGGTGLGLAICKELASLMGGRVWAESEEGRGSVFHATLALRYVGETAEAEPSLSILEAEAVVRPLRILAAEDNRTNQLVLSTIMRVMGHDLTLAGNGREAVEAWETGAFDLILMDVQMPEMDGVAATQLIRARESDRRLPRTPIIALSANAFRHQVREYLDCGMDAHVAKPIELAALQAAVEAAGQQSPFHAAAGPQAVSRQAG